MESAALECDGTSSYCTDAITLSAVGEGAEGSRAIVRFEHVVPAVEESRYGVAHYHMLLEGELFLQRGTAYCSTPNHLCWAGMDGIAPQQMEAGDLAATADAADGTLTTTLSALATVDGLSVPSPMRDGTCAASGLDAVHLFPAIASHEATYLGISDLKMYDDGQPEALDGRREVVQLGVLCVASLAEHARHYALWLVDCVSLHACRSTPSVAFRRAASSMYAQMYDRRQRALPLHRRARCHDAAARAGRPGRGGGARGGQAVPDAARGGDAVDPRRPRDRRGALAVQALRDDRQRPVRRRR